MDAVEMIRRLHAHRDWVNGRLCEAAATLPSAALERPFAMGRGGLWATLAHLYGAERTWLATLRGDPPDDAPPPDELATLAALRDAWSRHEAEFRAYLDGLTAASLSGTVVKRASDGAEHATPVHDALLHVCTHAQYTTAQAANMLRHLGAEVPDTQLIAWSRGSSG